MIDRFVPLTEEELRQHPQARTEVFRKTALHLYAELREAEQEMARRDAYATERHKNEIIARQEAERERDELKRFLPLHPDPKLEAYEAIREAALADPQPLPRMLEALAAFDRLEEK